MNSPEPGALALAAAATLLPLLAAVVLALAHRSTAARRATWIGVAAGVVCLTYLAFDMFLGFGRMAAVYGGVGAAMIVGAILGRILRSIT